MVHKASYRAAGGINDHVLVKVHQVIALEIVLIAVSSKCHATNLVVLVDSPHPPFAFGLSQNLAGILHDDLVRLKGTVAAHSISTVWCFDNFDANVVFPSSLAALFELLEASVPAFASQPAIAVVAFVKHVAILTVLVTASLFGTKAL